MEIKPIFDTFLSKYNNKFVEKVDSSNLNQCFDLAVAWLDDLGLPRSFNHLYAKDIYKNPTSVTLQNFNKIPNGPTDIPQVGDVVVWDGTYNGGVGHVGIATGKGDTNTFECFEQNDPTGSNSHIRNYNYNHVLGWLRDKRVVISSPTQPMDPIVQRKASEYDRIIVDREGPQDTNVRTEAQDKAFRERMVREMKRAGLLDQVGQFIGLTGDSNVWTLQQFKDKFQPQDTATAREEGRKLGLQQAKDAVNKLV